MGDLGLSTSLPALGEHLDAVGLDYYHQQPGLEAVRRRTQRLVGSAPLAFAPELGAGAPPWFVPRSDADSVVTMLAALAHGLRGFNVYMAVERDRWYGAPLDAEGEPRPIAATFRALLHALRETELWRLERKIEVALCIPREYVQLTRATHALAGLSPTALDLAGLPISACCVRDRFGFAQATQLAWEPLLAHLDAALCEAEVPFVYVDGDADLSALPDLRVVIAPSFEHADRARMAELERFAARGGAVVIGPHVPHLDEHLRPHAFSVPGGRACMRVEHASDAEALIRALDAELSLCRSWPVTPRPASACVWLDAGRPRVVFVLNPSPSETRVQIRLPEPLALVDALDGERFAGNATIDLPMAAHGCRMLRVEQGR
jgi:beta-galactosidase